MRKRLAIGKNAFGIINGKRKLKRTAKTRYIIKIRLVQRRNRVGEAIPICANMNETTLLGKLEYNMSRGE